MFFKGVIFKDEYTNLVSGILKIKKFLLTNKNTLALSFLKVDCIDRFSLMRCEVYFSQYFGLLLKPYSWRKRIRCKILNYSCVVSKWITSTGWDTESKEFRLQHKENILWVLLEKLTATYAASLLDREAWQCEQIALLARNFCIHISCIQKNLCLITNTLICFSLL